MPKGPYDAIIYGHSHLWELSRNAEGKAICNTGSITFPKGGNPPTLATLEDFPSLLCTTLIPLRS